MKTHPELPLDHRCKGDLIYVLDLVEVWPLIGRLFDPVYGDKVRVVLLNQEAQHAINMA
jgi:hypothetical protein